MDSEDKLKKNIPSVLDQWKSRKKKAAMPKGISPMPDGVTAIPSLGQQRLWVLHQLHPENSFYQYAHIYKIKGELDVAILSKSFQHLCHQHEILRTNFIETDKQLNLVVKDKVDFDIEIFDVDTLDKNTIPLAQKIVSQTFDLSKDLLIRATLLRVSSTQNWIILSMHHIIGDQLSLQKIRTDLFNCYHDILNNRKTVITKQPFNYSDFAWWQSNQKSNPEDLQYWLNQLSGDLPLLTFPSATPRPLKASFKGKTVRRMLSPILSKQLQELAKAQNTTLYVFLLAAFKVLLYRNTGQTNLLVGTPFSNRDKVELENLIGFFNETIVIRSELVDGMNFAQLITEIKTTTLDAFQHKNVPFSKLVNALKSERHSSANPIFQVMYLYTKINDNEVEYPNFDIQEEVLDLNVSKFDMTLFVTDKKQGLEIAFEYSEDLFEESVIEHLFDQFDVILHSLSKNIDTAISQLPILSHTAEQKICVDWNKTGVDLPEHSAIHHMIEEMAIKYPNKIAVTFQDDSLSYEKLNQQGNAIASTLIKAGVQPNTPVGLYIERSVEMIAGLLGILKAGAGYLPLDSQYPVDRNQFLLQDSGTNFILTTKNLTSNLNFTAVTTIFIEDALQSTAVENNPLPNSTPEDLAYIIYTSGSSGKPKGVVISHANLLHSTLARFAFYSENPTSFLLLSSFSFDSSVAGIFWTLCSGGQLVLAPKRIEQDMEILSELISNQEVTHTLLLPSLYAAMLKFTDTQKLKTLKNVMVAGEACPIALVNKHFEQLPQTRLYNEYGPTEASVWCIAHEIQPDESHIVPIGKAIPNTQVYILDNYKKPVPVGVVGQLHIGGAGLSAGYLNNPDLTAEKFIPNPFTPNTKIYKTGDLAAYLPDGRIKFLGRADSQVKIRGFRVELDEIQKAILLHSTVEEAVVIIHSTTNKEKEVTQQLVAYISTVSAEALSELSKTLGTKLPSYMVPTQIIPLAEFPHLPNGKIDNNKLPAPDTFESIQPTTSFSAPTDPVEKKLVRIWEAILNKTPIGITDNFFAIGGDSILSIQMVSKAKDEAIQLAPHQLFEHQTIEALAKSIQAKGNSAAPKHKKNESVVISNPTEYPLSYLQNAFLFNNLSDEFDQGKLLLAFTITGEIDFDLFQKAWQKSVKKHDAMRAFISSKEGVTTQVIADEALLKWKTLDYLALSNEEKKNALSDVKKVINHTDLDLSTAPVSEMHLITLAPKKQLLLWSCHHVFLDGWSCGIILKDALTFYDALTKNIIPEIATLPNFPAFLAWQKGRDMSMSKVFWIKELDGFNDNLIFHLATQNTLTQNTFKNSSLNLSVETTDRLHLFCQQTNITLPTLCQGIWAVLLSNYFSSNDVVYGLTVSGRFADFPDISSISGLFMDVVPNRLLLEDKQPLTTWLQTIQKHQGEIALHENSSLDKIKSWINHSRNTELFDSLFVFGNFLKNGLTVGELEVVHFEGGFSSTYPLTIRINPVASMEVNFRYNTSLLSLEQIDWFKDSFSFLLETYFSSKKPNTLLHTLQQNLANHYPSPITKTPKTIDSITAIRNPALKTIQDYVEPRSLLESQLSSIWQTIFPEINVGVTHNFFDLGGTSLMAIDLFSAMEKKFDYRLAPAALFKAPTISSLAILIENQEIETKKSSTLVPLRSTGNKPPIFCVHGGGAHVFFYQSFAACLPDDQPIYSLQPKGLDGDDVFHANIEEMATHYTHEIQTVQKEGPYFLLGTCFSNPVVLEMAEQLQSAGHTIAGLFIIDSAPVHLFGNAADGKSKTLERFFDMLKRGDFNRIQAKIKRRFKKQTPKEVIHLNTESESEKNLRLTIDSLNTLYANYHYKPFDGEVLFIRSSEFHGRKDKKYHLTQWKQLAIRGLHTYVVPGHHKTLFEYPAVKGLANKVNQCLIKTQ